MEYIMKKLKYRINGYGYWGTGKWLIKIFVYYFIKYLLRRKYVVKRIYDYKMLLSYSDPGISRGLIINHSREEQLREILLSEIEPGMNVLDIGANIGYYALMEANIVGEKGNIFAVEPSVSNFELLQKNISLNGFENQIKCYKLGISDKVGKENFFLSTHSNLNTFIKDGFKSNYTTRGTSDKSIEIEVVDLSTFLVDKPKIDFIRMDVEGYEVEIINGLEKAIYNGKFAGKIVFESHFPKYSEEKHDIIKPLKMLFSFGYFVKTITSNNESKNILYKYGYEPYKILFTGGIYSGLYNKIKEEHLLEIISKHGGLRDILLEKRA